MELIKVREEREQVSQLAQNKFQCAFELITQAHSRPYRRLIFDCERQWTPILIKEGIKAGVKVAELVEETQHGIWDHFAGHELDTLIFSRVPDQELQRIYYHQLILLTPMRPLSETIAMLDWALSHTYIKEPLRIDLLYTSDTPEELAMIETAEASLGINLNQQ